MKKFYAILCLAIASLTQLQAQAPQGFNYQATVRNSAGDLIVNANVYFKFNVIQGSLTAVPIFTETHYVPTDDLGQVNLVIGQGTANTGAFSALDWSLGSYYLGIELDTGNGYLAMGTTQLLSVPYALYAENSGNATSATPNLEAVLAENNSANNQQIKDLQDPTEAQDAVTKAYADNIISSFGYQQWNNNQVWNANTTISPEPNSFWFINADNTTITLPPLSNQGDVIKIYYMGAGLNNFNEIGHITFIDAQTNNLIVGFKSFDLENSYTSGFGYFSGVIKPFRLQYGLNEIVQIGDYWMLGEIEGWFDDFDFDNDGYTVNQGDCDDNNAQINPGATEIEDGIDNDCDEEIDEDILNGGTVTDQDGNTYDYLTYGDQVWTVENAEMVTYRDGTEIPQVTDATEWANLTTGAWSYFNNDPTKPKLYNWFAVMGIHDNDPNTPNKEFAPEGWHVPSDAEWTTLENHLIANGYNYDGTLTENYIAKAMASTTGWISDTGTGAPGNDQSLNNDSGFNAFPEGGRANDGSFLNEGSDAVFWSSTETNTNYAWLRYLTSDSSGLNGPSSTKRDGFSVRFVRD